MEHYARILQAWSDAVGDSRAAVRAFVAEGSSEDNTAASLLQHSQNLVQHSEELRIIFAIVGLLLC